LVPTVGPAVAPAGVHIRTGFVTASGVRVVSGLVQRLGLLDFVSDNVGSFGNMAFSRNGTFVSFGAHRGYFGTALAYLFRRWCTWHPIRQRSVQLAGRIPAAPLTTWR
jgi:hypothetical protein